MGQRIFTLCMLLYVVSVPPARATEYVIGQKGKVFSQSEISIRLGDALVFENDDDITYNVFSQTAGMKFNLKMQSPGESGTVVLTTEGTAAVRCAFHPTMKLTVTVKK
jgi:plastocyanin